MRTPAVAQRLQLFAIEGFFEPLMELFRRSFRLLPNAFHPLPCIFPGQRSVTHLVANRAHGFPNRGERGAGVCPKSVQRRHLIFAQIQFVLSIHQPPDCTVDFESRARSAVTHLSARSAVTHLSARRAAAHFLLACLFILRDRLWDAQERKSGCQYHHSFNHRCLPH